MLMIVLNLIHIVAAAFWAGSVFLLVFFIDQAVEAAGPAGGTFMQNLMGSKRLQVAMPASGGLTVLSGLVLYWLVSGGIAAAWVKSPHGMVITVGGLAGIAAAVVGGVIAKSARLRFMALMQEAGGRPSEAQKAELRKLKSKGKLHSQVSAALIFLALACMAIANAV